MHVWSTSRRAVVAEGLHLQGTVAEGQQGKERRPTQLTMAFIMGLQLKTRLRLIRLVMVLVGFLQVDRELIMALIMGLKLGFFQLELGFGFLQLDLG